MQGVGDFLKALPPVPECWFTVVMPDYGVSTPEAFAAYDTVGSSTRPDCEAQEKAIRAGDLDAVCAAAGNALEECSGAKDNEAIKALLRAHGAVTALMTGSGARFFAEQFRNAAKGSQAHQRKHDAGPHRGAAAQQPAHKVELKKPHEPPVHTAHNEQQQAFARCSASGKKANRENPQISRLENIKYFSAWFTGRYPHRPSQ